jgi:hypothetical protein
VRPAIDEQQCHGTTAVWARGEKVALEDNGSEVTASGKVEVDEITDFELVQRRHVFCVFDTRRLSVENSDTIDFDYVDIEQRVVRYRYRLCAADRSSSYQAARQGSSVGFERFCTDVNGHL